MIYISPFEQLKLTLRPGAVYYFQEESFESEQPHYFIVLNHNPLNEPLLFLVCSSSKIRKTYENNPDVDQDTLVIIKQEEYKHFKVDSVINCNILFKRTHSDLIKKIGNNALWHKECVNSQILDRLRKGVHASKLVDKNIKEYMLNK